MTYEKFVRTLTEDGDDVKRKDIKSFTIKYTIVLFVCTLSVSSVVAQILGGFFASILAVLGIFLYLFSFDLLADSDELFCKVKDICKFWWLISLVVSVACVCLSIFVL